MNKKSILKVVLIVTLVVLIFAAGYTFSKYYTEVSGSVSGSVARWSFVARGNGSADINNIKLIDTADQISLVDEKIAPGTEGSFAIDIDATGSEVGVKYSVEVLPDDSNSVMPANLKFYLEGDLDSQGNQIKYDSLEDLAEESLTGSILPTDESKIKTLNIKWEWPFETDSLNASDIEAYDADDMAVANGGNYIFSLRIIGEQLKNS